MINTSGEWKTYMISETLLKEFTAKATVNLQSGVVLNITEEDITIGGMKFYDGTSGSGKFDIGAAIINEFIIKLNNIEGKFSAYDFTNAVVVPYIGLKLSATTEWLKKGSYVVDSSPVSASVITLICLDNLNKFDTPFSPVTRTFPCTAIQLLQAVCSHCGVTLATTTFTNYAFSIATRPVDTAITCREIVAWVAQLAGCYARCNTDGALELKWYYYVDFGIKTTTLTSNFNGYANGKWDGLRSAAPYIGKTITYSARIKAGLSGAKVCLFVYNSTGALIAATNGNALSAGVTGVSYATYTVPANAATMAFGLNIPASAGSPAYVDCPIVSPVSMANACQSVASLASATIDTQDIIITGVEVKAKGTQADYGETVLYGETGYVLSISDNPLIQEGNAETIANSVGAKIVGMTFRPLTVSALSDPSIEAGDPVYITDTKGVLQPTLITNLTYAIGSFETLTCDAETVSDNNSTRYSVATKTLIQAKEMMEREINSYDLAVNQLTSLITNGFGLYKTEVLLEDGSTKYYMHNRATIALSETVWTLGAGGIMVSVDHGVTWGIDVNGNALFNVITAHGINADWINAGSISANVISTGKVQSEDGNTYFDLDTGEIKLSAMVGTVPVIVTMSPTNPFELMVGGIRQVYVSPRTGKLVNSIYDFDEDGIVDGTEMQMILDYMSHVDTTLFERYPKMDINGDGKVNSSDMLALKHGMGGVLVDHTTAVKLGMPDTYTNEIHSVFDEIVNRITGQTGALPLVGNLTGNCSGSSGSCTGNAATATNATNADTATKLKDTLVSITTQGWHRVYTHSRIGTQGNSIILEIGTGYNHQNTISAVYSISVGYNTSPSVTQLSGRLNSTVITKIRVLQKNTAIWYVDIFYNTIYANPVYFGGVAAGDFALTDDIAAIPADYTVNEYDLKNGFFSHG